MTLHWENPYNGDKNNSFHMFYNANHNLIAKFSKYQKESLENFETVWTSGFYTFCDDDKL